MGALFILGLAAVATGVAVVMGKDKLDLRSGFPRKIRFADGSTPANESRLRALFSSVVDEGGGVYRVTPSFDGQIALPAGSTVVGAAGIELWAAYLRGAHVGFAFNKSSADLIHRTYPPITFVRSAQAYPSRWGAQWKPVWGDSFRRTVWGRFLSPHDHTVADYLRHAPGVYASYDPDPSFKTPSEWQRIALGE